MFIRIDLFDKENDEWNYTLITFKTIHKIFDRYFNISDLFSEEGRIQFKEYQRAYKWIQDKAYFDIHDTESKTFFKNTEREKYLIVSISNSEEELGDINYHDEIDEEKNETS